jgi:hypothetical protein
MFKNKTFKFELVSFYYNYWNSQWSFDICLLEYDFEYDDSRSFFGIGQKNNNWFIELFWIRILPRHFDE